MKDSIKYYGITIGQLHDALKDWDRSNDLTSVKKVYDGKTLSVWGESIEVMETELIDSEDKYHTEITREQFDEFYKKTVEKINKAAAI